MRPKSICRCQDNTTCHGYKNQLVNALHGNTQQIHRCKLCESFALERSQVKDAICYSSAACIDGALPSLGCALSERMSLKPLGDPLN